MELKCVMSEDDSLCFFSQVVFREERYKLKRNVMVEDYPHHVFHIYPPLIMQNLLPYQIFIEAMVCEYILVEIPYQIFSCGTWCGAMVCEYFGDTLPDLRRAS